MITFINSICSLFRTRLVIFKSSLYSANMLQKEGVWVSSWVFGSEKIVVRKKTDGMKKLTFDKKNGYQTTMVVLKSAF